MEELGECRLASKAGVSRKEGWFWNVCIWKQEEEECFQLEKIVWKEYQGRLIYL